MGSGEEKSLLKLLDEKIMTATLYGEWMKSIYDMWNRSMKQRNARSTAKFGAFPAEITPKPHV
jgi:hypothetical protein